MQDQHHNDDQYAQSFGKPPSVPSNPLLGCPFCGGPARLDKSVVFKTPVVFCLKCNAAMGREYGSAFRTPEEVAQAWNRRHPNARPHAEAVADSVQADVRREVEHG